MRRALRVEWMKVRRAPVVLTTGALLVVLLPLLVVAFYELALSDRPGAAALKARAIVVGDGWDAYLGLAGQLLAVGMFLGPGIVASWSFGREFADRTFPSLFALPVSRQSIAGAKLVVLAGWGVAVAVLATLVVVAAGALAGAGSLGAGELWAGAGRLLVASVLSSAIATTSGLAASIGRGYLPAVGAVILLVAAAQVAVLFGAGGWFPYASPGLLAVGGADGVPHVTVPQVLLVPVTVGLAGWATVRWWGSTEVS